ncbi:MULTISPECIES: TadE family type IV pilus minor pilin [unclassified Streptomyces]|uniref:TadE family type IV pilus minor pilin n=1 Tax=unclassified Streptomyces TaxID=2593676 RepID=UPI00368BBE63
MARRDPVPGGAVRAGDRGFVTAEAAVVLPSLVLVGMALVWALLAASAQIQCVDAARAGARSAARQDPPDTVLETARRAAPRGARVTVSRTGDLVRVKVTASAPGPGALALELSDEAVALAEETVGVTADDTKP